jgi:glycosyltransferase involved in cell wall biosynthesis
MFDVLFSTTLGEGFGLPMFEAMACGTPLIVPDWSALGELVEDGGIRVPCTSTAAHPNQVEVMGGVMDKRGAIEALDALYRNRELRQQFGQAGVRVVNHPRYRWENIGQEFLRVVERCVNESRITIRDEVWADLSRTSESVERVVVSG